MIQKAIKEVLEGKDLDFETTRAVMHQMMDGLSLIHILSSIEAILNKAIEQEVEAYEFYLALSQKDLDASIKQIFTELAAEEKDHKLLLQSFLDNPDKPLRFKPSADFKVAETVDLSLIHI